MPSDPHSFDELKLPFIFVPRGAPVPTELLGGYADWIKLPATLEPDKQSAGQGERPVGAGQPGRRGSAGEQSAPPNPGMPQPPAGDAMSDDANATPGASPIPDDPIAAYGRANDALMTMANGQPRGHSAPPDVPPASALDDEPTNPDQSV